MAIMHVPGELDPFPGMLHEPVPERRVCIGDSSDRVAHGDDPDIELMPENLFEPAMFDPGTFPGERTLVERGIGLEQPEEHLHPRPVEDNNIQPVPLGPHTHLHRFVRKTIISYTFFSGCS